MKGQFFQKPYAFKLEVQGESWQQGQTLQGTLSTQSTSSDPIPPVFVALAHGQIKKAATIDSFTVLEKKCASPNSTGTFSLAWEFPLDINCPITDKNSSLYLIYGQDPSNKTTQQPGLLQIPIHPCQLIQDYLKILQIDLRFVLKTLKSNKGTVEAKLSPPTSKNFASLEYLTLRFQHQAATLQLSYQFNLQAVDASSGSVSLTKAKKELSQIHTAHDFKTESGRFHFERVQALMEEALKIIA